MTCLQKLINRSLFVVFILLFYNSLFGDGGFFYDVEIVGNSAESPNQRALIIHDGTKETLILQVKYSGTVSDFAGVVPVSQQPETGTITTTSDSIFQILHKYTQPRIITAAKGSEGWWMPAQHTAGMTKSNRIS